MKRYTKPLILLSLMAAIVLLDRYYGWSNFLSGPGGLEALREAVRRDVLTASLIYLAATTVACVLLALPGVTFAIIAGLLFGPLLGAVLCLAAATLGAVLAFLAGRYFLRDAVAPWVERNRYLKRVLFEDVGRGAGGRGEPALLPAPGRSAGRPRHGGGALSEKTLCDGAGRARLQGGRHSPRYPGQPT